ncbi:hypothetical protein Scep_010550 [Stephania cephalantha]|uniref:Uncharacterized protein n=1 Tax=Stephania cephalantha TaxID=152367 RepID=A0AAP0JW12_9MAGN
MDGLSHPGVHRTTERDRVDDNDEQTTDASRGFEANDADGEDSEAMTGRRRGFVQPTADGEASMQDGRSR